MPDVVDGEVRGSFALVTDISARRRADLALADAESRFRTLFESALIVEADGRIRDLNPAAETVLRRTRAELIGLAVLDITHREDREAAGARLARLAAGEITSFTAEERFVDPCGKTIWTQVDATVLGTGEDVILVEQIQDVSERRRHERPGDQRRPAHRCRGRDCADPRTRRRCRRDVHDRA